jgi:hypothetical protein
MGLGAEPASQCDRSLDGRGRVRAGRVTSRRSCRRARLLEPASRGHSECWASAHLSPARRRSSSGPRGGNVASRSPKKTLYVGPTSCYIYRCYGLGWLRRRVYALTQPNFSIDIPEELAVEGKRLYLISVASALGEIRSGGKLRTRFGTDCVELDGDRARELLEKRRNYDWSAAFAGATVDLRPSCDRVRARSLWRHPWPSRQQRSRARASSRPHDGR